MRKRTLLVRYANEIVYGIRLMRMCNSVKSVVTERNEGCPRKWELLAVVASQRAGGRLRRASDIYRNVQRGQALAGH